MPTPSTTSPRTGSNLLSTSGSGRPSRSPRSAGPARRGRRLLVAVSATATLALGSFALASPANAATSAPADNDPIGGLVHGVTKTLGDVTGIKVKAPSLPKAPSVPRVPSRAHAPAPSHSSGTSSRTAPRGYSRSSGSSSYSGSSSTSRSTAPSVTRAPDHASGSVAKVTAGRKTAPVVVSGTGSRAARDHASAQAKLLAIGSYSLIGSQADSDGDGTGHGPVPGNGLCRASDGTLCLALLYADSSASSSNGTSDAASRTGVADLCVGGDDASGASCSGLGLGLARSQSHVHTSADGKRSSTSSGSAADLCADQQGSCLVGGSLLGSKSASGNGAGAAQKPTLASLLLGDYSIAAPDGPIHTDVTKGCDTEIVCSTLNDKATKPGSDDSGSAVDLTGLGDALGAGVGNSDSGSAGTKPTTPAPSAPAAGSGKQGGSAHGVLADVGLDSAPGLAKDGLPIVGLSDNRSTGDLDQTKGDATLLSLLGQDLIASHADSNGDREGHGPIPGNPLCTSTGGALCADLLYADSAASKSAGSSSANTRTGVAAVCLGGHDASGKTCDGLELGLGQGASSLDNNGVTGVTTSATSTSLANLCLHGDMSCLASADALSSSASADSTGKKSQDSSIADLGLGGQEVGAPGDPINLSVPTDCPQANLACLLLNQVGAGAGTGNAGTSTGATVVDLGGLGNTVGVTGAGTSVSANGGEPTVVEPPVVDPPVINPPVVDPPRVDEPGVSKPGVDTPASKAGAPTAKAAGPAPQGLSGLLPNTGGVPAGVLGLGLLLVAAGAAVLAGYRRRRTV